MSVPALPPGQVELFLPPTTAIFQPLWGKPRAEKEECLSTSSLPRSRPLCRKTKFTTGAAGSLLGPRRCDFKTLLSSSVRFHTERHGYLTLCRRDIVCDTTSHESITMPVVCLVAYEDKPTWIATYVAGTLNVQNMKSVISCLVLGFTRAPVNTMGCFSGTTQSDVLQVIPSHDEIVYDGTLRRTLQVRHHPLHEL